MATPPPIELANLGMADSLILMVMALVVFGPRRLPQIGRQIGKLMYEFRKASNDFKYQMEEELRTAEDADRKKKEEERLNALALAAPPVETPTVSAAPQTESPDPPAMTDPPPSAAATDHSSEPEPRILPPATGEPIPAARPNRYTAAHTTSDAAIDINPKATVEANAADAHPTAIAPATPEPAVAPEEQTAHHG
jgi:sec-independent protein translocase protein TatB